MVGSGSQYNYINGSAVSVFPQTLRVLDCVVIFLTFAGIFTFLLFIVLKIFDLKCYL